ncbi:Cof-type HAD-IIB family hydrolase [Staphylococcus lugdunensis]|uniref:Cof-type HAD-IIB family hydrolase n=1 Tax=Staphylococcus lugdunensis TaxID=28035 RepID=UPI001F4C57CD|nr:Cof-type HAD-IIB family hydrolase [Staphylococcus lugdunensis]MCH8646035.1 Cof-type HAD-IIB family hydrolase [Staphylococcus lugdunensis]
MTTYQVVVMDMDDTLLTRDNKVDPITKQYLIDIQNQGIKVILASGRPTEGMLPTAYELKLDMHKSYIMSYNGGQTISVADESIVAEQSVRKEDFDAIVDYCRQNNFFAMTYQDGYIIYDDDHEYMNIESEITGLPMKRVNDLKQYIQQNVPKVLAVDYEEHITKARQHLAGAFNDNVDVTTSKPYFLEFMAKNVSKGHAISSFCDKSNIDLAQVICFGDSPNDMSMFKVVGYAVAMGNATDDLKAISDEVTLDNNANGIPHALKQLLNI